MNRRDVAIRRDLVRRLYLERLSFDEIARRVGGSVHTAEKDVERPRDQARLINVLRSVEGRWMTAAELVSEVYGPREDGGPLSARNCLTALVRAVRARGYPIESKIRKGIGYRFAPTLWEVPASVPVLEAA
jgi:DNA-binding response OmpR family regulator